MGTTEVVRVAPRLRRAGASLHETTALQVLSWFLELDALRRCHRGAAACASHLRGPGSRTCRTRCRWTKAIHKPYRRGVLATGWTGPLHLRGFRSGCTGRRRSPPRLGSPTPPVTGACRISNEAARRSQRHSGTHCNSDHDLHRVTPDAARRVARPHAPQGSNPLVGATLSVSCRKMSDLVIPVHQSTGFRQSNAIATLARS